MKSKLQEIIKNPKSKLIIIFIFFSLLFSILAIKLFTLQIIEGAYYLNTFNESTIRTINVSPTRGSIYDRNGIPLATNKSSYTLKMDPSIIIENQNETILSLINLLESNNDNYINDFPITETNEFSFDGSESREIRWKKDIGIIKEETNDKEALKVTPNEVLEYLTKLFQIDSSIKSSDAKKIMNIRVQNYMQRYSSYIPITIAYNLSQNSVIEIEEKGEDYPSFYVELSPERVYPYSEYVSHLIGYTGNITKSELETLNGTDGTEYSINDIIGKTRLEKTYEEQLRGQSGSQTVEVTYSGKRQNYVDVEAPKPAENIYLTLDLNLQIKIYDMLKNELTKIIIEKINTSTSERITAKEALLSLVKAGNLPVKDIFNSSEEVSIEIKNKIIAFYTEAAVSNAEERKETLNAFISLIETNTISEKDILISLIETKNVNGTEEDLLKLKNNDISSKGFLIDALEREIITPAMLCVDPYTASSVVVDVNTGEVLAAVSYPSFDNNQLVNNVNNEYYSKILQDPSQPMMNRAFMDAKSPGSTLKMITAITGMEEGVISPTTLIRDGVTFTEAGLPYASCWSSHSHGMINVSTALEVSCNYFFYETAYRLGNSKSNTTQDGISTLNKYMTDFGLNDRTGVEVGEHADVYPDEQVIIASPEYKDYNLHLFYEEPSAQELKWYDGDTIRAAIGQSENYYTPATMAKYVSTIANGGTRYKLTLLDSIRDTNGNIILNNTPVVEKTLEYSDSTWEAIKQGMYNVTHGSSGTARSVYNTYPITVVGKTGTVQANTEKSNHSTFISYAPLENPEIAVYTTITNGDTKVYSSAASKFTKKIYNFYYNIDDTSVYQDESQEDTSIDIAKSYLSE